MVTTVTTTAGLESQCTYAYKFALLCVRAKRRFRSLLTIFAMMVAALAALAPAITNALGRAPVANWDALCSAQATKRNAVNAAGKPLSPADQARQHAEHCPFCHSEHSPSSLPHAPATLAPQAGSAVIDANAVSCPTRCVVRMGTCPFSRPAGRLLSSA